jgi:hypothetical protein
LGGSIRILDRVLLASYESLPHHGLGHALVHEPVEIFLTARIGRPAEYAHVR